MTITTHRAVVEMKSHYENLMKLQTQRPSVITSQVSQDSGPNQWLEIYREKRLKHVVDDEPDVTSPTWLDIFREKRYLDSSDVIEELMEYNKNSNNITSTHNRPSQVPEKVGNHYMDKTSETCERKTPSKRQIELRIIRMLRNCNTLSEILDAVTNPDQDSATSEKLSELKMSSRRGHSRRQTPYYARTRVTAV